MLGGLHATQNTQHATNNELQILCQHNKAENLSFLMETFSVLLLCLHMKSFVTISRVCVCDGSKYHHWRL